MAEVELAPDSGLDQSWRLSLYRVLTIYNHFLRRGLNPDLLRVEAFGKFRPMYSDATPAGRRNNRRVDIVLDRQFGPMLLELNARPGLNIQIANRCGLALRLRAVERAAADAMADSRIAFAREHFAGPVPGAAIT